MGFSLKHMFEDLSHCETVIEYLKKVEWWKQYAIECGVLK